MFSLYPSFTEMSRDEAFTGFSPVYDSRWFGLLILGSGGLLNTVFAGFSLASHRLRRCCGRVWSRFFSGESDSLDRLRLSIFSLLKLWSNGLTHQNRCLAVVIVVASCSGRFPVEADYSLRRRLLVGEGDDVSAWHVSLLHYATYTTLWVSSRLWTAEKIMRCLKIGLKNAPTDVAAGFGVIHGGSTKLVVAVRLCAPPNILWDCRQSVLRSGCFCAKPLATLLDDVSGEACDGDILAVLGASGAGKSTLIDALAGRVAKESLRGSVTLNGDNVLQSSLLKVISAYVMQDDLLFPMLTVKETLMFASEFRLPRSLSKSKKMERVEALIDQLGLRNAADTRIGDEGHRGVSGGERRRVSIGIDIIHDPIVLFLDEPTSGLDSTNAFMVVQVLKRIAQSGSIVIMSIHQPSARILDLLDRLIILSRGKSVFNGSPANLPSFFSDFGHPIPERENITEFSLDLVRELEREPNEGTRELVDFNDGWQKKKFARDTTQTASQQALSLKEAIDASVSRGKLVSGSSGSMETISSYANPSLFETFILAKRYMKNWIRMPELVGTRIATVMVTGFLLATVYWKLDNTPKGAQERLTLFAFVVPTMFFCCLDNVPVFIQERYIFLRETAHNGYRTSFLFLISM
uniref:ABC transporter domain-containing protein n=1 Tax=Brassica campestris TaxID=3711 RepID=M4DE55_BRACM